MTENALTAEHEMLDTGDVQIIPRYNDDEIMHLNCLIVAPFRKTAYGPRIMATVEHYCKNKDSEVFPWTIVQVTMEAIALKAAMEAALTYAQDNNVPVILLNQDGFSTAAEKQQTDTILIRTRT